MGKFVVLYNWEDTIVNQAYVEDFEKLLQIKASESTFSFASRIPLNQSVLDLIKYQLNIPYIEVVITTRYYPIELLDKSLSRACISSHNRFKVARILSEKNSKTNNKSRTFSNLVRGYIQDKPDAFICICQQDIYKEIFKILNQYGACYNIIPCLYYSSWPYFSKIKAIANTTCFADSVSSIANYIACLTKRPSDACFKHIVPDKENALRIDKYFLFDYYPTGESSVISEPFSLMLRKEVKESCPERKAVLTSFFFRVLKYYVEETQKIKEYSIIIVPSSEKDCWNEALSVTADDVFSESQKKLIHAIKRTITQKKQHLTGERSLNDQMRSLKLSNAIPSNVKTIILVDDIVTTGKSFSACAEVLRRSGYNGTILYFAVGGTRNSKNIATSIKNSIRVSSRQRADSGYIFDLDGTLVNSDCALAYREKHQWNEAIRSIQNMKPYFFIIETLRQLIEQGNDVAIVTSSPSLYCRALLKQIGVDPESVIIVAFHDTKTHKPMPEPFLLAESLMPHDNKKIICVGDKYNDLFACKNTAQEDVYRKYIPLVAGWHSTGETDIPFGVDDAVLCASEFKFSLYAHTAFIHEEKLLYFYCNVIQIWAAKIPIVYNDFKRILVDEGLLDDRIYPTEQGTKTGIICKSTTENGKRKKTLILSVKAQLAIADIMLERIKEEQSPNSTDVYDYYDYYDDYFHDNIEDTEEEVARSNGCYLDDEGEWRLL